MNGRPINSFFSITEMLEIYGAALVNSINYKTDDEIFHWNAPIYFSCLARSASLRHLRCLYYKVVDVSEAATPALLVNELGELVFGDALAPLALH